MCKSLWEMLNDHSVTGAWSKHVLERNLPVFTETISERLLARAKFISGNWLQLINSLRSSDAIWRPRSGSTLAQVMACCLTAPSHYLHQCWLIIREVLWQSYEGNITGDTSAINYQFSLINYLFEILVKFPRGQWVKYCFSIWLATEQTLGFYLSKCTLYQQASGWDLTQDPVRHFEECWKYIQNNLQPQLHRSHVLTHWTLMYIYALVDYAITGSDNGLAPVWCQAIIWTNVGLLFIVLNHWEQIPVKF